MNADWAPGGRQPLDQAWAVSPPVSKAAAIHITIVIRYYYSARKMIFIFPSADDERLSLLQ